MNRRAVLHYPAEMWYFIGFKLRVEPQHNRSVIATVQNAFIANKMCIQWHPVLLGQYDNVECMCVIRNGTKYGCNHHHNAVSRIEIRLKT